MFAAIIGMALRAASALCLVVGLLSAPARAETLDELYTKAKTEKSLVIYAGGPVSNYEPLAREFESKFPGLTVSIEGGFSNVLNQKIERQFICLQYAAAETGECSEIRARFPQGGIPRQDDRVLSA